MILSVIKMITDTHSVGSKIQMEDLQEVGN